MMEDTDEDAKARKRRRRSIRNLRRQSGIVPFSLNDEPSSTEQPEKFDNGKEDAPKDDPYGSLWMEAKEPVKVKKRRQSNLMPDLLRPSIVLGEDKCSTVVVDEITDVYGNELISQPLLTASDQRIKNEEDKSENRPEQCENNNKKTISYCAKVNQSVKSINEDTENRTYPLLSPNQSLTCYGAKVTEQKNTEYISYSEITPPGDVELTTPQSMSPEFPLSPADNTYVENHDDSYICLLPTSKSIDRSKLDQLLNENNNVCNSKIDGRREVCAQTSLEHVSEESSNFEVLGNSYSEKESLSDKENTIVESESIDQEDDGKHSESPGFLSLCKAFAGKVVDLVKTSPTYLSNILQDSKTSNLDSPSVRQDSVSRVLSPQNDKSFSEIKLALETELNMSLENRQPNTEQIIQVYNVTGISKPDSGCEHKETDGKGIQENKEEKEVVETVTKETKTATDRTKKKRKSVSKKFFNTFNAVSNALNKTTTSSEPEECQQTDESVGFYENDVCPSSSDTQERNVLGKKENVNKLISMNLEIGSGVQVDGISESRENSFEIKNDDCIHLDNKDSIINGSKTLSNKSLDKPLKSQLPVRDIKCRSTDIISLNEECAEVHKEKLTKKLNTNNSSRKRRKSGSEGSLGTCVTFTDIKCQKKSDSSDSGSQLDSNSSSSSVAMSESCSSESISTVNVTDSTVSVLEGLSKLDLEVSILHSDLSQKDILKQKQDRRRRRSNNFYFPSLYNEAEEKQNESYDNIDSSSNTAHKIKSKACEDAMNIQIQDCPVNEVTKEISQVNISDRNISKSLEENVDILADCLTLNSLITEVEKEANKRNIVNTEEDVTIFSCAEKSGVSEVSTEEVAPKRRRRSADAAVLKIQMQATDADISTLPTQSAGSTESSEELGTRRKRRRSADAAVLKMQMQAKDFEMSPVAEQNAGPAKQNSGRRRKKSLEIPLEDIYRNKNYVKPQDKTWATIFESPKTDDQVYSKRKSHTYFNFDNTFYKPSQEKVKKRIKRAVKNGWDPKKRKRQALPENEFQVKISNIFSELDEEEGGSLVDKLKHTIQY